MSETGQKLSLDTQQRQEDAFNEIDLVELFYRLLNKWWIILLAAIICSAATGYYNQRTLVPSYRATATIYVVNAKDSVINVSDLSLGSMLTTDYVKIFDTWELHEQVAEKLGLDLNFIPGILSVSNKDSTRMLDLTVTSESAQWAADLANAYADIGSQYIADTMSTTKPNIVSAARVPEKPYNVNYTRVYLLGFAVGALLAVGILVVLYLMDDKVKTSDDVRRCTGLVTLGMIPTEDGKAVRGSARHSEHRSGGDRHE